METKIIKVVFGGRRYAVTNKRTRTDYGQMFEFVDIALPNTFEVIFSNSNTSAGTGKKMIGSNQRCLIPDEYLKTGQPIYAWVLVHDGEDDGRHMYSIKSPVDDMPDTSPEEPTPVEQSVISQAITALNSAVTTTTQKAQEATESANRAEQAAEGVEGYAERAEAAQSASENARDIALEAKVSAQTSAATASEKASEAISSATTASQSALTAESASESAQEYATASAESASQASQSADTASGKASDASEYASNANTSAQTASQKASEAAQSASTAVQAKTDAETAKTASQTAQGLAESARDGAVTAKTNAESARDEAQEIVDGITGKVEQIDSNTERIESLEDDRYKPYPTDTASGSIASFPDGADGIPLKSCIVHVEPVQDLHGYDSPWPAGGGTNQWDEQWELGGIVNADGTTFNTSDRIRSKNFSPCKASTTYYGCSIIGTHFNVYWYDTAKGFILWESAANKTITSPSTAAFFKVVSTDTTVYTSGLAINNPSTVTTYAPYENICPISGWTGCEVWNDPKYGGTIEWNQVFPEPTTMNSSTKAIPVGTEFKTGDKILVTFNGSKINSDGANPVAYLYFGKNSNRSVFTYCNNSTIYTVSADITADGTDNVGTNSVWLYIAGFGNLNFGNYNVYNLTKMFGSGNEPKTVADFNALFPAGYYSYNAGELTTVSAVNGDLYQRYPITFPTEAGTVYGAYVDVTGGELVVNRAMVDLGTLWWAMYNVTQGALFRSDTPIDNVYIPYNSTNFICSNYQTIDPAHRKNGTITCSVKNKVDIVDNRYSDAKSFKEAMSGVQLVYELAEPIHYPLTVTEIRTLLGQNNVWADCGDTEVEYRADTTLYINKKIAEAISALS